MSRVIKLNLNFIISYSKKIMKIKIDKITIINLLFNKISCSLFQTNFPQDNFDNR